MEHGAILSSFGQMREKNGERQQTYDLRPPLGRPQGKMDLSPPQRSLTTLAAAGEEGTRQVVNAERRVEEFMPRSPAPSLRKWGIKGRK